MSTRTLLVTVALLLPPSLAAAECPKWDSNIWVCAVYPQLCDPDGEDLTFGEEKYLWSQVYSDTPEQACDKAWHWYAETNPNASSSWPTDVNPTNDPDIYDCCVLWNNTRWWCNGTVELDSVGEPECALVPQGPYTYPDRNLPRPAVVAVPGGRFTSGWNGSPLQRDWILEKNFLNLGGYGSDLGWDDVPSWITRVTYEPYNDDPIPPETPISSTWDNSLQIDHILPRVDIYGCPCGTNGYNNALVISGGLNRAMSNDLHHPDRIAILQQYVPGYVAPLAKPEGPRGTDVTEPLVSTNEPGAAEEPTSGGCATGHPASSVILLLFAFGLCRRCTATARGRPRW